MEKLLNIKTVSKELKISKDKIKKMILNKEILFENISGNYFVYLNEVKTNLLGTKITDIQLIEDIKIYVTITSYVKSLNITPRQFENAVINAYKVKYNCTAHIATNRFIVVSESITVQLMQKYYNSTVVSKLDISEPI